MKEEKLVKKKKVITNCQASNVDKKDAPCFDEKTRKDCVFYDVCKK